jgi:hypothetical protein
LGEAGRRPVRLNDGEQRHHQREAHTLDLISDARRLASVGTFFIIIGWVVLVYALIAGVIWWIDLASREAFNFIEAFAISASAIGLPIIGGVIVLGFGYGLRLFALYVASKAG